MTLHKRLANIENSLNDCLKIVNKLDEKSYPFSADLLLLISNEIDVIALRLKHFEDFTNKKENETG